MSTALSKGGRLAAVLKTANHDLLTVGARIDQLGLDEHAAAAVVETLNASPQMRSADALHAARRLADDREQEAARARQELERTSAVSSRNSTCIGAAGVEYTDEFGVWWESLSDVAVSAAVHRCVARIILEGLW